MNKIIVIGGDHHNTYGVIRAFGKKNLRPFVLIITEDLDSFLLHSRFIDGFKVVKSDEEAIDFLYNEQLNFKDAVVIACSDSAASALDCNRNKLSLYKLPGSIKQGRITEVMNKEYMSSLGREVGFNIPQSWIVETAEDIKHILYPCITKPILSKDGHKSDIAVCYSSQELMSILEGGSCYRYQVQEFIEKDFEYQLIGLSLNEGKDVIIPGVSRCIRPCPRTNTGFLHYEPIDDLTTTIDKCKEFIRETGYSGLFSIEFLRDKEGVDYFMEMNFRNDGNAICVTAAGINLPYIWYLYNIGSDYSEELSKAIFRPVYVMPELPDFENFVYTRKISLLTWIKDVYRTDTYMVFNFADIKPFLFQIRELLIRIKNKLIRC